MRFSSTFGRARQSTSAWLVPLFLLVGVFAPTAAVLWFMNEAARGQAESARQRVAEAYRGQLRFVRDRIDDFWQDRAEKIAAEAGMGTPADFQRNIARGLADSVIYLNADGSVAYPAPFAAMPVDALADRTDWRSAQMQEARGNRAGAAEIYARIARADQARTDPAAARAAQAIIRGMVQSGDKVAAINAIEEYFGPAHMLRGVDSEGRLIAADEQLLALRLLRPNDRRRPAVQRRLITMLNDYERTVMPAAQRIFLMGELVSSGIEASMFPTLAAERLAAQYLEAVRMPSKESDLQPTPLTGVWSLAANNDQLITKGGQVIALYRAETLLAGMRPLLNQSGPSNNAVRFSAHPPGAPIPPDGVAAGHMLPGWQLSFDLSDTSAMEAAARTRVASYLWAGYLVIAAIVLIGFVAANAVRQQMRLARLKTDLVSAVSHELRTPLASMRILVDSLLEDDQLDTAKTRDYLHLISGENLRLTRLIENFLTFSRIERNRHRFEFHPTQPAQVIAAVEDAMRERLTGPTAQQLVIERAPQLPAISADRDALVTVLLNLLDNAFKFTPIEKRIALRVYCADACVVFSVEDNGIGIGPGEQKRIFRSFYQVDQRLARETGGCGLGLSIVDFIVRAHGGEIDVQSQLGSGSQFRVMLPCSPTLGSATETATA